MHDLLYCAPKLGGLACLSVVHGSLHAFMILPALCLSKKIQRLGAFKGLESLRKGCLRGLVHETCLGKVCMGEVGRLPGTAMATGERV